MDVVFSFTFGQACAGFLALCTAIVAISAAVDVVKKKITEAKKPESDQNERLRQLENESKQHLQMLARDKERLEHLEDVQGMQLRGIYALLEHAIDGNNVEAMQESKREINKYLFNR